MYWALCPVATLLMHMHTALAFPCPFGTAWIHQADVPAPDAHLLCRRLQVFYAFIVDSCLYYVWQIVMMGNAPAKYKYVPFLGLAAWLVAAPKQQQQQGGEQKA
jgi:hypothetical protein